jgi:hypothetical protein
MNHRYSELSSSKMNLQEYTKYAQSSQFGWNPDNSRVAGNQGLNAIATGISPRIKIEFLRRGAIV